MALTQVDQGLLGTYAQYTGFKNRIINGAMGIWQRGTGVTATAGTTNYCADRWIVIPTGANLVVGQGGAPAGFPQSSLNINGAANVSNVEIQQRIESVNCTDLVGSYVTVSGYIYQSIGSAQTGFTVRLFRPNSTDNYAAITQQGTTYTIPSIPNATWTKFTCTFPTDAYVGYGLVLIIDSNTALTSNAIALTGVQLEKGSTATSFDYRPYGTELALCQRYYQKSYMPSTAAGTATDIGSEWFTISSYSGRIATTTKLAVTMRAAPTITAYDWLGASGTVRTSAGNGQTGYVVRGPSANNFTVDYIGSSISELLYQWTASAEL